jgi:hypothetical protein
MVWTFNGEQILSAAYATDTTWNGTVIVPGVETDKQRSAFGGDYGVLMVSTTAWSQSQIDLFHADPYALYRGIRALTLGIEDLPAVVEPESLEPRTPSETSIANGALVCLGLRRINSLNEPTRNARALRDRFDDVRDEVLRMVPWNFATRRTQIAADATAPLYGFHSQYTLPADCLRVIDVDNPFGYAWRVEGRKLLFAGPSPISIEYTAKITDVMQMDVLFRQAFSASLAVDVAELLTGSSLKLRDCFRQMAMLMERAATVNGQERSPRTVVAKDWERSRGPEGDP